MAPRFDVVGLVVSDMAASITFYRRLGFDFAEGAEAEGHVETALPGGLRLVLDPIDLVHSFDPGWSPAGYDGHLPPWDAFWGQRYATVHDPDGNAIELLAPLDG